LPIWRKNDSMSKTKEISGSWKPSVVATGLEVGLGKDADTNIRRRWCVEGKYFAAGSQRLRGHGVTYGPVGPNSAGEQFPTTEQIAEDFLRMRAIGINAIRTYHLPPERLLDLADEHGISICVDVPWPRHLCFLEGRQNRRDARQQVRRAAELG